GRRRVNRPAGQLEPRIAKLRLEAEPPSHPLRRTPDRHQHDQGTGRDLAPQDFCPGHGGGPSSASFWSAAQASLSPETPVDSSIASRHAGDVATDLLFKGGRPGHELEAEAVVDHGEAARGEREPLAIGAGDIFSAAGRVEAAPSLCGKLLAYGTQLAAAQGVEQPAGEDDTAALPLGEALFGKVLGTPIHRLAHFRTEPAAAHR